MYTSCSFFPFTSPFSNIRKFGTNPLPGLTCLESRKRVAYQQTCLWPLCGWAAVLNSQPAKEFYSPLHWLSRLIKRTKLEMNFLHACETTHTQTEINMFNEVTLTDRLFQYGKFLLHIHVWRCSTENITKCINDLPHAEFGNSLYSNMNTYRFYILKVLLLTLILAEFHVFVLVPACRTGCWESQK